MPDIIRSKQWVQDTKDVVAIPDWHEVQDEPEEQEDQILQQELEPQLEEPELETQIEQEPEPQEQVRAEPEPLTEEELLELYRPQWEQVRITAQRKAYYTAVDEYREKLQASLNQVHQHLDEIDQNYVLFLEEYGRQLKYLAVDIAEKWLSQKLEQEDTLLESLVMQAVGAAKECKWMDVQLSEKMVALSERIQEELRAPEYLGAAQVSLHDQPVSACIVETNFGKVDASIQTQAQELRQAFQEMDAVE